MEALRLSEAHDGKGDAPGVKFDGDWDERPHNKRIVRATTDTLARWQKLSGEQDIPVERARLLTPVSTAEDPAIDALAGYPLRLGALSPQITRGFDESGAKKSVYGHNQDTPLIDYNKDIKGRKDYQADTWEDVVLKGPQIGVANPFFKQPSQGGGEMCGLNHLELPVDAVPESEYRRVADEATYRAEQDRWLDRAELERLRASDEEIRAVKEMLAENSKCLSKEIPFESVDMVFVARATRPYTQFYRMAWREMIAPNTERSLYPAVIPPGAAHIHSVRSAEVGDARGTILLTGFWSALPVDYLLRTAGVGHLDVAQARRLPAPEESHPLAPTLLLRTLRLNCLTTAYADLWEQLHDPKWGGYEPWARTWPLMTTQLHATTPTWQRDTPLRAEYARRSALVETDALVAVWLGIDADTLITMYRARFPVLQGYESVTWFDSSGRKIAGVRNAFGHGQDKDHWKQFEAYMADPAFKAHQADPTNNPAPQTPVPDGYTAPFYKADRETEMREAHAYFQKRLDAAVAAGQWDPVTQEVPKP